MRIMRQLTFSLILLVAIAWLVTTDKVPDCPTCVMPCRGSNLNRQSLTELYSSYVDSFTVTTILDGYEGNFKITISQNTTDYLVYSNKISVVHWYFSVHCRILCEIPVITTVVNDSTQLKVQFPSFRFFFVHLQSLAGSIDSLFYIKVGILQNELYRTKEQLSLTSRDLSNTTDELSNTKSELSDTRREVNTNTELITVTREELSSTNELLMNTSSELLKTRNELSTTKGDLSITQIELSSTNELLMNTSSELLKTRNELSTTKGDLSITQIELENSLNKLFKMENELFLMNETLQSIKHIVLMSCGNTDLSSVIANAVISSTFWRCYPSGTNAMVEPDGRRHCYSRAGEYVYFDFRHTFNINVIRFKLYDRDSRIFTYSLDISTNRVDWTSLAAAVVGTSTEEYILEEPTRVRYIRMEGTNTDTAHLILHSMSVDCVFV